jgi:hypothetical protein
MCGVLPRLETVSPDSSSKGVPKRIRRARVCYVFKKADKYSTPSVLRAGLVAKVRA